MFVIATQRSYVVRGWWYGASLFLLLGAVLIRLAWGDGISREPLSSEASTMSMASFDSSPSERPTQVRYGVLAFSVTMSLLLYLDRFAFSISQTTIMKELGLDEIQIGHVGGVFFYVYALTQVPSGWFSDRFGGRITLTLYVLGWSIAIGGMGLSVGLISLIVTRSLLGFAQAGAYPCIAGVIKNWFPLHQRGVANSLTTMGGRLGNLICLALTPQLMALVGLLVGWQTGQWRIVFALYAMLGILWAVGFWKFFRNRPSEHPRCNQAEVLDIAPTSLANTAPPRAELPPFLAMARCPTIYLLSLISIWVNVGWIFLATWLPTYLESVHHLDKKTAGLLAVIPGAASMLGGVLGGLSTDRLVRRWGLNWGRRITGVVATAGASIAYFIGLQSDSLTVEIITFAAAGFMIDFGLGSLWAVYQDIAGRHVSSVLGFGNMCGNLAAGGFTSIIGYYAKAGDWNTVFAISVGALLITMTCWLFVNPSRPLLPDE